MRYDDKHRKFVQVLMHAGIVSDFDFQRLIVNIFNYGNSATFYKTTLNTKLDPLGFMIYSGLCEFTGQKYWMIASTTVDNVTKVQSQFSQAQLELLRKTFTEIIESVDGSVTSTRCLNLCTDMENKFSQAAAEAFLVDCVKRMWLAERDGNYYMGVRSIIELMPYFNATFEEGFNTCPLCKQTVFHGHRCAECQVVSHLYCLAKLAQVQIPLKCPNCSTLLPDDELPEVPSQQDPRPRNPVEVDPEPGVSNEKRMKRSGKRRH